jgi:microcystin-dependent protein
MEPYVGQIQPFAFSFAPRGWAPCDGRLLSINQYTAVFSLLGTVYGGNGQTTFALPDLRGRGMVSQGQGAGLSSYTLGETGGHESMTLIQSQMPIHTHVALAQPHTHNATAQPHTHTATATATMYGLTSPGDKGSPAGRLMAGTANMYGAPNAATTMALDASAASATASIANTTVAVSNDPATVAITSGSAGGSQPFDNRAPFLCLNICIAIEGLFPPRN